MSKKTEEKLKIQKLRDIPPESYLSTGIAELDELIGGGWPRKRISQIAGVPGCFAEGTPVLTTEGYVPIESVGVGDMVATFDGSQIRYNKVINSWGVVNQPKPMIQFTYNEESITATYDHPFYSGGRYYPLYQLAWRDMETSERIQLKLLCEQYGQTFDHKMERGVTCRDSETWERPKRPPKNGDEREDSKGTSSSSADLATKSRESSSSQPFGLQSSEQQSRELGVVYSKTEQPARIQKREAQRVDSGSSGSVGESVQEVFRRDGTVNTTMVGHSYRVRAQDRQEDEDAFVERITNKISSHPSRNTEMYETEGVTLSQVTVKEAEPYYAIEVEDVHTYVVGHSQFPVHNSGKSYLLAMTMASMKENEKALYVDTEFALNKERLEQLGVDIDRMDYLPSSKLEEVTTFIIDNVQDYDLIVIDTLARLTPMTVLENEMNTPPIALAARMISQFDALLRPKLFNSNCAVVGINQVRANMGYGNAETKAAGGFAWLHAIDLSLKIARKSNKTHSHVSTVKIDKSRVGHPFKAIDIEVKY